MVKKLEKNLKKNVINVEKKSKVTIEEKTDSIIYYLKGADNDEIITTWEELWIDTDNILNIDLFCYKLISLLKKWLISEEEINTVYKNINWERLSRYID